MRNAAQEMADAQRAADLAHHQRRIDWLDQEYPVWACGARVAGHDKEQMLSASLNCLANPDGHHNHCSCEPRCA